MTGLDLELSKLHEEGLDVHAALTNDLRPEGSVLTLSGSDRTGRTVHQSSCASVRVALFVTCLNDTLFPEAGIATVRVLERLGHDVEFPEAQTCCGQLHFNTGYQDAAATLARRFVQVFAEADVVVAPSASCVAMVREFYPYLAEQMDDADLARDVRDLIPRVVELTEFLVTRLGVTEVGALFRHRVTYHPTCHSLRALASAMHRLRSCAPWTGSISSSCRERTSVAGSVVRSR